MALSRKERYRRVSKRAGVASGVCLAIFVAFLAHTVASGDGAKPWLGIADGIAFLALLASVVISVSSAVLAWSMAEDNQSGLQMPSLGSVDPAVARCPDALAFGLTSQQSRGRAILATILTSWFMLASAEFSLAAMEGKVSRPLMAAHCARLTIMAGLFYAVWNGHRWARRLILGWCALSFVASLPALVAHLDLHNIFLGSVLLVFGGVLAFSKTVGAFLSRQRARRFPWSAPARRRAWLIAAGLLFVASGIGVISYLRIRSQWPESLTRRLAELKSSGVPVTLAECDAHYRSLGTNPAAVEHFQRTFAAMTKDEPPLMGLRGIREPKSRPALPRLSEMETPQQRNSVSSCLRSNTEALRLLHEGLSYERCAFPIKLADGFQALLPHLDPCKRAAQLLALESVENAYEGNTTLTGESLVALVHLAEILRDEPTLVSVLIRDRIVATACESLRTSLNVTPLSMQDLGRISARLQSVMAMDDKAVRGALVTERCLGMSIFQGSDQQIADFLQQRQAGLGISLSVEAIRVMGILQRDALNYLECMDRLEVIAMTPGDYNTVAALAGVASDVERNQHLVAVDKKLVNVISSMLLPSVIRAMQAHIWTRTFGDATLASLAVARYRQQIGHLPVDLAVLVPQYLSKIPDDAYTAQPFRLHLLAKGYAVSSRGSVNGDDHGARASDSDGVVFRVER